MLEGFDQRMQDSDSSARMRVRGEFDAFVASIDPDPDKAHPEVDLRDRAAVTAQAWRWTAACIRACAARAVGGDVELVAEDSDLMFAQMQAAAASGW